MINIHFPISLAKPAKELRLNRSDSAEMKYDLNRRSMMTAIPIRTSPDFILRFKKNVPIMNIIFDTITDRIEANSLPSLME